MKALTAKGLSKYYPGGKTKALDGLDLEVDKGKIFSLLGPNGAGKTTLFKLMLSIVRPTKGTGRIFEKNISDPASRLKVGYLSEDHKFPGYLNGEEFLYYYGKMSSVNTPDLKKRIPDLLETVRLGDKKKLKIKKYSKGMLQRLGTAQALINEPELLFLDEPTDGIDPVGRIEIRNILKELKEKGKTVFINSHLLSEVERVSDEIAILKSGRMIKKGSPEDFITDSGRYSLTFEKDPGKEISEVLNGKGLKCVFEKERILIETTELNDVNFVIDTVRKNDINIVSVEKIKNDLEDFFIKVVK